MTRCHPWGAPCFGKVHGVVRAVPMRTDSVAGALLVLALGVCAVVVALRGRWW